jgi:hypothetical protein
MDERIKYLGDKPWPDLEIGDLVDVEIEGCGIVVSAPWRSADCDLDEVDIYYLIEVKFPCDQFAVDTDDITILSKA